MSMGIRYEPFRFVLLSAGQKAGWPEHAEFRRMLDLPGAVDVEAIRRDSSGCYLRRVRPGAPEDVVGRDVDELLGRLRSERGTLVGGTVFVTDPGVPEETVARLVQLRDDQLESAPIQFFVIPRSAIDPDVTGRGDEPFGLTELTALERPLSGLKGPVLLEGETGTGKTRLAKLLHAGLFERRDAPFHTLNCAALDTQSESIALLLRGVVEGYYTGVGERPPIFEKLHRGTLFLDEFQDLKPYQQATLLDLLEQKSTLVSGTKVGSTDMWRHDVQVVVAINEPLSVLLESGRLRADVHFRLSRRTRLDPLRAKVRGSSHNRPGGAPLLRRKLLRLQELGLDLTKRGKSSREVLQRRLGVIAPGDGRWMASQAHLGGEAMPIPEDLVTYDWPGNYRELETLALQLLRRDDDALGRWSEDSLKQAFAVVTDVSIRRTALPESSAPATPQRLLALAWLGAVATPISTLASVARVFALDRRTVEKRLRAPPSEWVLLDQLTEAERESWTAGVARLLGGRRPT